MTKKDEKKKKQDVLTQLTGIFDLLCLLFDSVSRGLQPFARGRPSCAPENAIILHPKYEIIEKG